MSWVVEDNIRCWHEDDLEAGSLVAFLGPNIFGVLTGITGSLFGIPTKDI